MQSDLIGFNAVITSNYMMVIHLFDSRTFVINYAALHFQKKTNAYLFLYIKLILSTIDSERVLD